MKTVCNQPKGFSIIEVMIAVVVISALGMGIYRLQLAALSASQQSLTRQLMMQSATNMAEQIYAHMNYCASNSLTRAGGCIGSNNFAYTETAYSDHTSGNITDCSSQNCNDSQYADFVLSRWKSSFGSMNLPSGDVFGIVCRDNSFAAPTASSANCNGSGNLVIKMFWQPHIEDAESQALANNNFLILRVPQR